MNVKHFSVLIFSILFLGVVFAAPGIPHQFYGTVTVNGAPANGASVTAKINGIEYASVLSIEGTYGYDPAFFFVKDPNLNHKGKTIEFYLNGTKVADYIFFNSAGELTPENTGYTELNLSIGVAPFCGDGICNNGEDYTTCSSDCTAPPVDPGSPPGGGSPGPGGNGSGSLNVTFSEKCINQDVDINVTLSNKKPATNATVKVYSGSKIVVEGKTSEEGIFSFNLAEAKEYKLEIRKPGYLTKKVDFSLADCAVEDEVPIEPEDIEDGTLEGAAGSTLTCDQINCDDLNPCTQDVCEDSACNYTQLSDVPCGDKGTCQEGACVEPKTKTTPPVTTGFLGLSGLQEQVAMGLGILIILGILFVGWTKFK